MKPIKDIWWVAVHNNLAIWPFLNLTKRDVVEVLTREVPDWKAQGYRIARLRVTEISHRNPASSNQHPATKQTL